MKILITGANGQLGNEMRVASIAYPQHQFIFTDVDVLDITDKHALYEFAQSNAVNLFVNCAAYTDVDKAEDDEAVCYKINALAVKNIGEVATSIGAKVIHISTDYVFDGTSSVPYTEDMPVCPTNVYGRTKLAGEQLLMETCSEVVIIRTSWLYSSYGNNFVKTMLQKGMECDSLNVIFDQVGTPTYAADLANAICAVFQAETFKSGIYHFSNEGVCSWYDFTIAIYRIADIQCKVHPIESSAYPVRTPRPHYSVLNKKIIKSTYGIVIPHWEESLVRCIAELKK